jgi:hypothetical protein
VRVVCADTTPEGNTRAFAFDERGRPMAGWPVQLGTLEWLAGRATGDELTILGGVYLPPSDARAVWLMRIAVDGSVRSGVRVRIPEPWHGEEWAIGPDGVAYGTTHVISPDVGVTKSRLQAVSATGVPSGFPITIKGGASKPAFDAAGLIHLTVGSPDRPPSRTLVFDTRGGAIDAGSSNLKIAAMSDWNGIEGSSLYPAAPLVGRDGATFIAVASAGGARVEGLSPGGDIMTGWPYRSDAMYQVIDDCPRAAACDAYTWAHPTIGRDDIVYLAQAAANESTGGSIVAVGQGGRVLAGWPVSLRRAGSRFWSIVADSDGALYALAVEPEKGDTDSATILAIARDGTVLYRTTIIEP